MARRPIAPDAIFREEVGAHVIDKAARGGGRQFYRFAGQRLEIRLWARIVNQSIRVLLPQP